MKKTLFITALAIVFISVSGCVIREERSNVLELGQVEVREYEGKKLSSVNDFRENSIKGTQHIDRESYKLKIGGLVESEEQFSYDELISKYQNYKKVITLDCVEGWSATILWEGFLVNDLFSDVKLKPGANTVIFHAADGYTTSFPLDYFKDGEIIIAYKMNDVELPPERGFPFQLIAESKWGYKWIKWITEVEFSDDENYRGYWEKRGYSNNGDLDKNFFERK